jgi:DNA-binding transcriptional MerR regulator
MWKTVEVEIDGVTHSMFTIGAVAEALDRSVSTIRVWESQGLLPKTQYRSQNGSRLYSFEHIEDLKRALTENSQSFTRKPHRGRRRDTVYKSVRFPNGEVGKVQLHRVRVLAEAINRTPQTVRLMERRKGLPVTTLRSGNQRLYTAKQIEAVQQACALAKKHTSSWAEIYAMVLGLWQKQNIIGAEIVEDVEEIGKTETD